MSAFDISELVSTLRATNTICNKFSALRGDLNNKTCMFQMLSNLKLTLIYVYSKT